MKRALVVSIIALTLLVGWARSYPANRTGGLGSQADVSPGGIVSIRELRLKSGIDSLAFEKFAAEEFVPAFDKYVPGLAVYILKGDRGSNVGGYVHMAVWDSKETRDYYFPDGARSPAYLQVSAPIDSVRAKLDTFVEDINQVYTDYFVLE